MNSTKTALETTTNPQGILMNDERATLTAELQLSSDSELGEFYAPFAYDDAVTDYRSIIAPDAFRVGQLVPFQVGHQPLGDTPDVLGLGKIERGDGLWALRGQWGPTEFAQEMRKMTAWQIEQGFNPDVSVGMDWRTWTMEEIGDNSAAAFGPKGKRRKNSMGETARWIIKDVPRVFHLALVNAGAMPGARVDSAMGASDILAKESGKWREATWRQATALMLGGMR